MNKLRKLKNKLIVVSGVSFPDDIDSFIKELKELEIDNADDIERSYQAYRLQKKYTHYSCSRNCLIAFSNYLTFFVIIVLLLFKKTSSSKSADVVYYRVSHNKGILPETYANMPDLEIVEFGSSMCWDKEVRSILFEIVKRYGFKPDFLLNVLFSLSNYNYIIKTFHPKEIVTSYESSISCAILTCYCHQNGVNHVNIMHGEKLMTQNNLCGHFDVMYVWDDYYKELFKKLKYKTNEYRIHNPWSFVYLPQPTEIHDMTFYLNFVNEEECNRLVKVVEKIRRNRLHVKVRMHPSQMGTSTANYLQKFVELENNQTVSIYQSLSNAQMCVSQFSTVLYQAYCIGKPIIIDDITNPKIFDIIRRLNYIMLDKKHSMLSDYLR